MDWGTVLSDVDYLAVALGVIASFVIGFVWYEPRVFGEMWRRGVGLTKKQMENPENMGRTMALTALFSLISTVFFAALLIGLGTDSAGEGALHGSVIGFTILGLRMAIHNNFAMKSLDHSLIEAGYDVLVLAVQGAIIGAFL